MIEIQIHPSDIRRKVRYFFLNRRAVLIGIGVLGLLLFFVIASMSMAPSVIRRVYKKNFLHAMRHERVQQSERLKRHVEQMTSLEKSLDVQRVRVEKLTAVYGLDRAGLGHGGLPNPLSSRSVQPAAELEEARSREMQLRNSVLRLQEQIELLSRYERENAELIRHVPSILPIPSDQFVLTSPFGGRISPFTRTSDFHKGLDLAAPTGTPIEASGDGVVTFAGRYPMSQNVGWWRFGNVVVVNHADRFITIYAHCDTVDVKAGQRVSQGERIATVGSTGWSTNSHLHYEVRSDLERPGTFDPVDPRIYILDYQWSDEEALLIRARSSKDYKNFDPLPVAFIGKRGV
jgi:murein DD-endopeptidase MepM/ murein hydrolase activator NlpD